jgi:hypothetical protein
MPREIQNCRRESARANVSAEKTPAAGLFLASLGCQGPEKPGNGKSFRLCEIKG